MNLLIVVVVIFIQIIHVSSNNVTSNDTRIAIIISGQLRSSNLTWTSPDILQDRAWKFFGPDDPNTPAECLITFLFKEIVKQGFGIDVFMFIQASTDRDSTNQWNGNAYDYIPSPGDTRGCQIFSNNEVFNRTGNHFFCLVENEVQLMNNFLRKFPQWNTRHPDYSDEFMNEQALQQYYGMYRGNLACKQYAVSNNVTYKYKIRLRPDTPLTKPIPDINTLNYGSTKSTCNKTVYYSNKAVTGHSDWFNIGLAEDMDHVLDRYIDFIATDFIWVNPKNSNKWWWDLEDHFERLLHDKYSICIEPAIDIWMVVIRRADHKLLSKIKPKDSVNDWVDLSIP